MGERTENVTFKLRAKDETGAGYDSARRNLESFIHESRATAKLVSHSIELGGIGIGAELLAHAMDSVTETTRKFSEAMETAKDKTAVFQAEYKAGQGFLDSLPVVGAVGKALREMGDSFADAAAAQAKMAGASEAEVDALRSDEGLLRHNQEQTEKLAQDNEHLTAALAGLRRERLAALGVSEKERALAEEEEAHKAKADKLTGELHTLRTIVNPDTGEKAQIQDKARELEAEEQRHAERVKNITERAKVEEADFRRHHNDEIEADDGQHQIKLNDLATAAAAETLRVSKMEYEADSELRRQHLADDLRQSELAENAKLIAIRDAAEQRKHEGKAPLDDEAEKARVRQHGKEERAAMKDTSAAQQETARIKHEDDMANERAERRHTQAAMAIDLLHEMGEMGSATAEKEARRLAIHEKFVSRTEQLNKLLREQHNLSAADRKSIEAGRDSLVALEAAEQKFVPTGPQTSPFAQTDELKFGQDASREGFTAGVRQREQDQRKQQEKELEAVIRGNALLQAILDKLPANNLQPAGLSG